jgi:hypothetical protein
MKFRKRPVVIEAEQWFPGKNIEGVREVDIGNTIGWITGKCIKGFISTLEGEMMAEPGDWIITGIKGERYPCKPDIFEQTYEKVEE